MTIWSRGPRRWLQAPVRKGVGSNPTAVTWYSIFPWQHPECGHKTQRSAVPQRAAAAVPSSLGRSLQSCWTLRLKVYCLVEMTRQHDSLALQYGRAAYGAGFRRQSVRAWVRIPQLLCTGTPLSHGSILSAVTRHNAVRCRTVRRGSGAIGSWPLPASLLDIASQGLLPG